MTKTIDNKFSQWLSEKRGRATLLHEALNITATNVSSVKTGRKRLPPHWIKTIMKLSKNTLKYEDLVPLCTRPKGLR